MSTDLVSVVITTFTPPNNLERALKTVLNQTYKNIEAVVIDGANAEENKKTIAKLNDIRIKYIGIENDTGPNDARNLGIKESRGKYIAFLDDDDEWVKDKITRQLVDLNKPNIGMVSSGVKVLMDEEYSYTIKNKEEVSYADLLQSFIIGQTSSIVMPKKVLDEIGYFADTNIGPEYDLALKTAKLGYKVINNPNPLMIYRKTKAKKSYGKKNQNIIRILEFIGLWKRYGGVFKKVLGLKGFIYNTARTLISISILFSGYLLGFNPEPLLLKVKTLVEGEY